MPGQNKRCVRCLQPESSPTSEPAPPSAQGHMHAGHGRAATHPKAAHESALRDWKERMKCYDLIVFREEKHERPDAACT